MIEICPQCDEGDMEAYAGEGPEESDYLECSFCGYQEDMDQ